MASGDEPALRCISDQEITASPPGMYWIQVQGLWALRPVMDVEGSSPTERLQRAQGVIACNSTAQPCAPSIAAVAHDTARDLLPLTPPPLPAVVPLRGVPDDQGWPDWLLQWGRRLEDEEVADNAPGPSVPPSVPPSPPERRSVASCIVPCLRLPMRHDCAEPPTAPEVRTLAQGKPPGPRREPSPIRPQRKTAAVPWCRPKLPISLPLTIQAAETPPRVLPPQPAVGCAAA